MPLGDLDFEVRPTHSACLRARLANNGSLHAAPAILHCFEGLSGKLVSIQLCSGRGLACVQSPKSAFLRACP